MPTHAGSFTLGDSLQRLLTGKPPSVQEKLFVLLTSTEFHRRVAELAADIFPRQIDKAWVKELQHKLAKLGLALKELQSS